MRQQFITLKLCLVNSCCSTVLPKISREMGVSGSNQDDGSLVSRKRVYFLFFFFFFFVFPSIISHLCFPYDLLPISFSYQKNKQRNQLTNRDGARASRICVTQIVCQRLNPICCKIVLVPQNMVMSWPTCSLSICKSIAQMRQGLRCAL